MTKCSYTRAPREGKIKSRDFFSGLETWRGGLQRKQTGIDQVCVAPPRPRAGRVRSARRLPRRHNLGHHVRSVLQDRDVGACRFATAGIRSRASTDRARLKRQNTPARPRSSLTATAPSLASTPPRSARACTSPSSSPARSSVKRYAHPPALRSDLPPVDAPRSSPAGQPGESDPRDESRDAAKALSVSLTPLLPKRRS